MAVIQNIEGAEAANTTAVSNPVYISGVDEANVLRPLLTDTTGKLVAISNAPGSPTSATQGPVTLTVTVKDANTQVIAAPGVGMFLNIVGIWLDSIDDYEDIQIKQGASDIRLRTPLKEPRHREFLLSPPWVLPENTALNIQPDQDKDLRVNVHFYVTS